MPKAPNNPFPRGPTAAHALRFRGPVTNLHEAPALGNGDLGALVQVFQHEFRLHLAKTDVWDARFDHVAADWVLPQADLIRLGREHGFRLEGGAYDGRPTYARPPAGRGYVDHGPGWDQHVFPCPKPVGLVRVLHAGTSSTRVRWEVDVRDGMVTAAFQMEFGWHGKATLRVEAFLDRQANAVRVRLRQEGKFGALRLCVEKPPDGMDPSLPPPTVRRVDDWRGVVAQEVPAGYDVPAFRWHLAATFPQRGPGVAARIPPPAPDPPCGRAPSATGQRLQHSRAEGRQGSDRHSVAGPRPQVLQRVSRRTWRGHLWGCA